jgi:hypothetical protein
MRIGINLFDFWSPGSRGEGVLNYIRGLLRGLAEVDQHNSYVVFLNRLNDHEFSWLPHNFERSVVRLDPRKRRNRVLWEQVLLPLQFRKRQLDLVHFPGGTSSILLLSKSVVTHHAANVAFYARNFRSHSIGLRQCYIAIMERLVIPRAARVITVSEFSRQELINRLRADPSRIAVVPHAAP